MIVCVVVVTVLALVPGCNKKGASPAGKKGSGIPELSKKSPSDTSDIFKEFYSDDTAGQGASKKSSSKATAKTQTFSPSPSSTPSSAPGEFQENGRYIVQVSCVKAKSFAEKVVSTLKGKNFPAYISEVQNPTPALTGTFYRIRIGGFGGFSSAKTFGDNTLVPGGYEYWIDKKSNDNTGMEGYGLGSGAAAASPAPNNAGNGVSPTSSWSSLAPAAESPSSSSFGQSDFNAAPSAPVAPSPTPSQSIQPAAAPNASTSPKNVPEMAPAAAPTPPPRTIAPPPSTPGPTKGNAAPSPESGDWGADSAASSSSSGW
jgi:hypothetical protein